MTSMEFLLFDESEGDDDTALFDAVASVVPDHEAQVEAEIAAVLAWAESTFPGRRAPVEEGGEWDAAVHIEPDDAGRRRSYALSVTGTRAFGEAFREQFAQSLS